MLYKNEPNGTNNGSESECRRQKEREGRERKIVKGQCIVR